MVSLTICCQKHTHKQTQTMWQQLELIVSILHDTIDAMVPVIVLHNHHCDFQTKFENKVFHPFFSLSLFFFARFSSASYPSLLFHFFFHFQFSSHNHGCVMRFMEYKFLTAEALYRAGVPRCSRLLTIAPSSPKLETSNIVT
jgi:hypothetical protein